MPKTEQPTNAKTDFLLEICNTSMPTMEKFTCKSSILLFSNLKEPRKKITLSEERIIL